MKIKNKIVILTYYQFPCFHPMLENVFAKELAKEHEIIWLFQAENIKRRIVKWHNSHVILCKKVKGHTWHSKIINKILEWQKFLFLLYLVLFCKIKIVVIRDMPFISLLIFPLKMLLGFKIYFQYSAPLGDISIGYTKIIKTFKKWWHALYGHFFNILIKNAVKISDIVFSISKYHKNELISFKNENKLVPITMGVDETWIKRKRNQLPHLNDLKKKYFLITYFGSLGFAKNPEFILQTFSEILDRCQNCKLLLIGKTRASWEKKELDLICLKLGINRHVIFTGFMNRNKLKDYLFYCDLSLSLIPPKSYYKISSPTKLYESLGNGVPVVGNRGIYEQEKVIRESGGGIIVDYDTTASCNAIIELLRDRKLRKKMATRGRKYVLENYSYQSIAKRLSYLFN